MHAIELVGLASAMASHAGAMLASRTPPREEALQEYWLCSRFRHESWCHRLAEHRRAIQEHGASHRARRWHEIQPVIEEVFLSEPLTRVLAYIAKWLDDAQLNAAQLNAAQLNAAQNSGQASAAEPAGAKLLSECWPIAANALAIHVETRHRCLNLIVFGQGLPVEIAVRLNRIRRQMEDFNDGLLATLPRLADLEPFCFDGPTLSDQQAVWERVPDRESLRYLHCRLAEWSLLRSTAADLVGRPANARLNQRLYQAALGWWSEMQFDGFGLPCSPRSWALRHNSLESDGRCADLTRPLASPLNVLMFNSRQQLSDNSPPRSRW